MKKALLVIGLVICMLAVSATTAQALPGSLSNELGLVARAAQMGAVAPDQTTAGLAPPAVVVNGNLLNFDVQPVLINCRWLVPMRAIFQELGAQVQWDGATSTALASRNGTTIMLKLSQATAMVNNIPVVLDSPAKAVNGRTMVPLHFVSEALDAQVSFSSSLNTVVITYTDNPGSSGLYYATMCESFNESTISPVNAGTEFRGDNPCLYAYLVLEDALNGTLAVNWYYGSGSNRQFVATDSYTGTGSSNIYNFPLEQSYFQDGYWQCELILDHHLLQTLSFAITDAPTIPDTSEIPVVVSDHNSHPWSEWGLGNVEEEYVDNDNRSYDWYIDQMTTGEYADVNCGPTSATMVSMWSDPSFNRTVQDARNTYSGDPISHYWYIDLPGKDADINNYLELCDIPYGGRECSSDYQDMTIQMKQDIRNGKILILCINSNIISFNPDNNQRTGKPYNGGGPHFIVVKGFATVDSETYFEVYDPANDGKTYDDGTPMCKNRYYSDDDIYDAMTQWWNRYLYVSQVDGSRSPGGRDLADSAWPGFTRVFTSSPAYGGW